MNEIDWLERRRKAEKAMTGMLSRLSPGLPVSLNPIGWVEVAHQTKRQSEEMCVWFTYVNDLGDVDGDWRFPHEIPSR